MNVKEDRRGYCFAVIETGKARRYKRAGSKNTSELPEGAPPRGGDLPWGGDQVIVEEYR